MSTEQGSESTASRSQSPKEDEMAKEKEAPRKLSRKDFVKGAAAVAGAGALAGCAPAATPAPAPTCPPATDCPPAEECAACPTPWLPQKWDKEVDVVVVGYGAGGAATAITAADAGANVLILEKAPKGLEGGNTSTCGGVIFTIIDPVRGPEYIRALVQNTCPEDVLEVAIEGSHGNLEWFPRVLGIEIAPSGSENDYPMLPSGSMEFGCRHKVQRGNGSGPVLFEVLSENVSSRSIEVMYETPGIGLIQDGVTKEVLGVKVLEGVTTGDHPDFGYTGGKEIYVKAKRGVVLATGGFEFNQQIYQEFWAPESTIYGLGSPFNTGDGLVMLMGAGAGLWHMGMMCGGPPFVNAAPPPGHLAMMTSAPDSSFIWVNKYGKRFIDELRPSHHGTGHVSALMVYDDKLFDYTNIPCWNVFDETTRLAGRVSRSRWETTSGFYDWSDDNSVEIAAGWVTKADTIAELAEKLEIDAAALQDTVNRWNEHCAAGEDVDFGRAEAKLKPLMTPPYYAHELCAGLRNTMGGARHNKYAQVLDAHGDVIPRLYEAGELGSIFGYLYNGGLNIGIDCMTFGRIAGETVAAESPWD